MKLVVDNTLVVPIQPFDVRVIVTRDDMNELRRGFNDWLNTLEPKEGLNDNAG